MFAARTDGRPVPTFDLQGLSGKDWWAYRLLPVLGMEKRAFKYLFRKVARHFNITEKSLMERPFAIRVMDGRVFKLLSVDGEYTAL